MEFNRFDVSAKELIWDDPAAWLVRLGIDPAGGVEVVDSDAATLTAAADKVLKVGGESPFLVDLEPHTYHDRKLVRTLWLRQVALDLRHDLPVLTVLVLLRKEANSPRLTGTYSRRLPDGRLTNRYHYRVVRLWKEDPEDYLNAGVALVPLAPLTDVSRADLPGVIRRMRDRIEAEPQPRAARLLTAAYFLMGLRYPEDLVERFLGGVQKMKESTTYQKVLNEGLQEGRQEGLQEGRQEGRQEEARRILLRQGTRRFGTPDAAIITALEAIDDIDHLEALTDRIFDPAARDWSDLLQGL